MTLLIFTVFSCAEKSTEMNSNITKAIDADTTKHNYINSLVNETSPYLLQHAHNPVNWYAWGDEALTKAKAENKLLLEYMWLFYLKFILVK